MRTRLIRVWVVVSEGGDFGAGPDPTAAQISYETACEEADHSPSIVTRLVEVTVPVELPRVLRVRIDPPAEKKSRVPALVGNHRI